MQQRTDVPSTEDQPVSLDAAVPPEDIKEIQWECPTGGEIFDNDVGMCPEHGVPVRKVGLQGEAVTAYTRESGTADMATGVATPSTKAAPQRVEDLGPSGERKAGDGPRAPDEEDARMPAGGDHRLSSERPHPADNMNV